MSRTMFDSTTAGDAPDGADLYADYLDLPASHDARATVHICRDGNVNDGHVLDVGEGVPNSQAPGWVRMRRAALLEPTCYTNYSNWSALRDEFARANMPEPAWWIAWYSRDPAVVARCFHEGASVVQWANPPISGGHYDVSTVAPHWSTIDNGADMTTQVTYLGRGMVQALHQIAFGQPAPTTDMDNVQRDAENPTNPGGWEYAIDDYIKAIYAAGGTLYRAPADPAAPASAQPMTAHTHQVRIGDVTSGPVQT